jgi:hypothetical protein
MKHFAGNLYPVVHEYGLHLRHDGSLSTKMRIAPMSGILGMADPLVGYSDSPREANLAVDDQHLSMRSVVHSIKAMPCGCVKPSDIHPCVFHCRELGRVEFAAA